MDDDLLAMAQACRPLMIEHPVDPQYGPDPSHAGLLHLTVEMLADVPSAEYDDAVRAEVAQALATEVADIRPFTTGVGPPIANIAGAVLDVWPEEEVLTLTERIRTAVRKSRGDKALQHSGGPTHVTRI
jgi:hypothetical protein